MIADVIFHTLLNGGLQVWDMKHVAFIMSVLITGAMLLGCVQQSPDNQGPYGSENQTNQYYTNETEVSGLTSYLFFYAGYAPPATVGAPYNYSFCDPAPTNPNDLCGAMQDADNPSGGHNPYHFTLGPGVGFQQFGLILNLNGLLTGTPTIAGNRTFEVCAVDLDGNQACDNVTMIVENPIQLAVRVKGTGSGAVTVYGGAQPVVCRSDCNVTISEVYATPEVAFMPDNGSAFGGWSGDCKYAPCEPLMDSSKGVTATFDKFALTASATCTRDSSAGSGYNNRVEIRGTAAGPKGASVVIGDTEGYNGYMDMTGDCGSWSEGSIGCVNKGDYSTTTWSSGFRMASPTHSNPFVWTPTYTLSIGYGDTAFYNESIQEPFSTVISVPVPVRCP